MLVPDVRLFEERFVRIYRFAVKTLLGWAFKRLVITALRYERG